MVVAFCESSAAATGSRVWLSLDETQAGDKLRISVVALSAPKN